MDCDETGIQISDDFAGYPVNCLSLPKHHAKALDHILISKGLIDDRTEKLAHDIYRTLPSDEIVILCVLKGAYKFFSVILDKIKLLNTLSTSPIGIAIDFVRLKSYVDDKSSGEVKVIGCDNFEHLRNKNVLIVEDIIDTGKTMQKLVSLITMHEPKSVKVVTLLQKRIKTPSDYKADFVGFDIPNRFVVGYGLDYNEKFRDLTHIGVINNYGKKLYSNEASVLTNGM